MTITGSARPPWGSLRGAMPRELLCASRLFRVTSRLHACSRLSGVLKSRKSVTIGFLTLYALSPIRATMPVWVSRISADAFPTLAHPGAAPSVVAGVSSMSRSCAAGNLAHSALGPLTGRKFPRPVEHKVPSRRHRAILAARCVDWGPMASAVKDQSPWEDIATSARVVSDKKWRTIMPDTMVDAEVLKDAVQLASRAPSLHNSQPWQWTADSMGLHLYLDRARRLYSADKSGREGLISCGAVLDHLRVAMAAAGWTAHVERFPDPNNLDHLASIDFSPISFVTDGHRRRADAILRRRTDRLPFARPRNWGLLEPLLQDRKST